MYSPQPRPQERNPRAAPGINGGFEQAAQANTQGIYGEDPDEADRALYELLGGTGQPNAAIPNSSNPHTGVGSSYGGNGLISKELKV